jgi:HlyD family secretion protein
MRDKILMLLCLTAACRAEAPPPPYEALPVARRSITVSVRAAGQIQPDTVVEVKSKASGEILEMLVETGQYVERGQLLVRVDQRAPRNELAQAEANLEVARARLQNAEAMKRRAEELFKTQSITEQELEQQTLNLANAQAEVIRAQVAVESARIAMEDTDVRAPISGTIIAKNVERGQVISSPTRDVGGGTVLLRMADLNLVQVRTLVDETDIGKIQPGLRARVTVDAYPNQPFNGEVLKIEPLAETVQNVTMFPVIVRIDNRGGLLKPGMNADVQIQVGHRDSVLAVPNGALRTARDVGSAAMVLGIGQSELQEMMARADQVRDSVRAAQQAAAPAGDTARVVAAAPPAPAAGNTMALPDGRTITLPEGVTESQVRDLMRRRFTGGELSAQERALLARVTQAMGGGGGGGPGGSGMGGRPGGGFGGGGFGGNRRPGGGGQEYQFGGDYIVFVLRQGRPTPVHIRTGLTDLDYAEVVWGLQQGDSVLVLPSASLVAQQQEWRDRMNRMAGQGVPGMRQDQGQAGPPRQAQPVGGGRS